MALAFVILGISLEYLQRLSGYRTFEYADMGANAAGVLCALLLAQTPLSRCLAVVERSLLRFIVDWQYQSECIEEKTRALPKGLTSPTLRGTEAEPGWATQAGTWWRRVRIGRRATEAQRKANR